MEVVVVVLVVLVQCLLLDLGIPGWMEEEQGDLFLLHKEDKINYIGNHNRLPLVVLQVKVKGRITTILILTLTLQLEMVKYQALYLI